MSCKLLCLPTPPLEPVVGAPGGRATTEPPAAQLFTQGLREPRSPAGRGLGTVEGLLPAVLVLLVWSVGGPAAPGAPLTAARRSAPSPDRGCHADAVSRVRSALQVSVDGSPAETVSPLVGVTDFATRGSGVIPPVLCVLDLIVPLLFSLKKISENC